MPRIVECIVTTRDAHGVPHIAPLGLTEDGDGWVLAPFKPSRTLDNLRAHPFAVASHTDDVRVYAGCLTGRRDWPLVTADKIAGHRLESAVSHWELSIERVSEDEVRPRFHARVVHVGNHRAWEGFNRAQAAVLECAVLVSRLHMLPAEKIDAELKYLDIAIGKTASAREAEAWSWLMARIADWRAGRRSKKA